MKTRVVTIGPQEPASLAWSRIRGRRIGHLVVTENSDVIERVSVRLEDVNAPRGGIDRVCRIKVVLSGLPTVFYEKRGDFLPEVVDGAIAGVERQLRRSLQRKRTAPIKKRGRGRKTVPAV